MGEREEKSPSPPCRTTDMLPHIPRLLPILLLLLLLPICWDVGGLPALAAKKVVESDTAAIGDELSGQSVSVELRSGKTLQGVVEKAVPSANSAGIAKLQIVNSATNRRATLSAAAIRKVTSAAGDVLLVFDAASKTLVTPDSEPSDASASDSGTKAKTKSKSRTSSKAASANREEERQRRNEAAEKYYKKTGVRLWTELNDKEQEAVLEAQKKYVQKVIEKFPSLNLQLYETQYYLFVSDIPAAMVANYTSCLDRMHEQLCRAFAVQDKDRVWLGGKLPVFAFLQGESFVEYEREFFKLDVNPQGVQGLAHCAPKGNVLVSCHCGKDPYYLAAVIVHETTHGFIHRYKSGEEIPSWLNEGMADWTAMNVVRGDKGVQNKVKNAIERMRLNRNMGGNFYTADHLAAEQYGMATAMVEYLLRRNAKGFRQLIEDIKKGEKWQVALQKSCHVTPEELTYQFGLALGIPDLRP